MFVVVHKTYILFHNFRAVNLKIPITSLKLLTVKKLRKKGKYLQFFLQGTKHMNTIIIDVYYVLGTLLFEK